MNAVLAITWVRQKKASVHGQVAVIGHRFMNVFNLLILTYIYSALPLVPSALHKTHRDVKKGYINGT